MTRLIERKGGYILVHVDVTARDQTALAEGASPEEVSGLLEVRRIPAVVPRRDSGGGHEPLI